MSDKVRMEYTGQNEGPISFSGADRLRVYRGANNTTDKYIDADPSDVETLTNTGRWKQVDAAKAQAESDEQTRELERQALEDAQRRLAEQQEQIRVAAEQQVLANEQATIAHNADNAAAAIAAEQVAIAESTGALQQAAPEGTEGDGPKIYSTAEAAEQLRLEDANAVRELISSGELKATKTGSQWEISQVDLDEYHARRQQDQA